MLQLSIVMLVYGESLIVIADEFVELQLLMMWILFFPLSSTIPSIVKTLSVESVNVISTLLSGVIINDLLSSSIKFFKTIGKVSGVIES